MSNSSRKLSENMPGDFKSDVEKLINEGSTSVNTQLITKLRAKYSDSTIVDSIIESLTERVSKIETRASKYADIILKHSNQTTPLHSLLRKALKYKDKLGLSDGEFELFKKKLFNKLNNLDKETAFEQGYTVGNTNLSRALGSYELDTFETMNLEQSDYPHLQEILRQYAITKQTYNNIFIQHIMYRDLAIEAMTGEYDPQKHNVSCYVHPIIAALFLPKIDIFERRFILANIAQIVKCRYEKQRLTKYDYELIYNLINDPNDIVCDIESPFKDLKNRCILQEKLWQSILALRSGKYYDCFSAQFLTAIDNCKLSSADAPDATFIGDEASMLKRLFQVFSFRPMLVDTTPIYANGIIVGNHPMLKNRVTTLAMITHRLPFNQNETTNLNDALNSPQYYLEGNTLVPKTQNIIYTNGIIIFHVPRKVQQPKWHTMIEPGQFNNILPTLSGFEKVNKNPVEFNEQIFIDSNPPDRKIHNLRSVVAITTHPYMDDLQIGSRTLLITKENDVLAGNRYFVYNPQYAAISLPVDNDPKQFIKSTPINILNENGNDEFTSFRPIASRYGTIFIYAAPSLNP